MFPGLKTFVKKGSGRWGAVVGFMIQIFIFKLLIFSDIFLFNLPGTYTGGPE